MTNRCVVDTANPVEVDQAPRFNFSLDGFKRGDSFFEATASTTKIVPIPRVGGDVGVVVPRRFLEPGLVPVNHEALAGHLPVVGHRQRVRRVARER